MNSNADSVASPDKPIDAAAQEMTVRPPAFLPSRVDAPVTARFPAPGPAPTSPPLPIHLTLIVLTALALFTDPATSSAAEPSPTNAPALLEIRRVLGQPTTNSVTLTYHPGVPKGAPKVTLSLEVEKTVLLDQRSVADATVTGEPGGDPPGVEIVLTPEGRDRFAEITAGNVKRTLAILSEGRIICAPRVLGPIPNGRLFLSGDLDWKEALRLAERLRALNGGSATP